MKQNRHIARAVIFAGLLAVFLGAGTYIGSRARAMFMSGDEAPVERLVVNITAYIKDKPGNPEAHYLLGRVNALAYSGKTDRLKAFGFAAQTPGDLPQLDEKTGFWSGLPVLNPAQLKSHLHSSITSYRAAIKLSPNMALYHLSLASIIEKADDELIDAPVEPNLGPDRKPYSPEELLKELERLKGDNYYNSTSLVDDGARSVPLLRALLKEKKELADIARRAYTEIWRNEAIQHYWLAYILSIRTDIPERERYVMDTPVSQEAGEHYLKLVRQRDPTELEMRRIPQAEKDLSTVKKRGMAMTPIIFSTENALSLDALLSNETVNFDMDGDGEPESIPWVKSETTILVWDPRRKGNITSGRQLFGTVTWWLFWRDGYEALRALDDNGDGELSGSELRGLGLWRDANSNGVSEAGEVSPIESSPIESLSVFSTTNAMPSNSPANPIGLRLKDGRCLPTYDWTFFARH